MLFVTYLQDYDARIVELTQSDRNFPMLNDASQSTLNSSFSSYNPYAPSVASVSLNSDDSSGNPADTLDSGLPNSHSLPYGDPRQSRKYSLFV